MSVDHRAGRTRMRHEMHFCYAMSLQVFGYVEVVHQFEKRCKCILLF